MTQQSIPNLQDLAIKTIAMPKDTNPAGDIFGGWLVSQMDLAGAAIAKKLTKGRVTTVAIHEMTFERPVYVGDEIGCYARVEKIGRTSITLNIESWVYRHQTGDHYLVTKGTFVFVSIDDDGKPKPIVKQS